MNGPLPGITESTPILVHRSVLAPVMAHLPHWRNRLINFLEENRLPEQEVRQWALVFSEMVTNAIRHSTAGSGEKEPTGEIILRWWIEEGVVWLEVNDHGQGPPEELLRAPRLPENPLDEGGRGLYIIRQFCDFWQPTKNARGFTFRIGKAYQSLHYQLPENPELELILDELSDCYENLTLFHTLFETLVKGGNFQTFVASALDIFSSTGNYPHLHLEAHPGHPVPEMASLAALTHYGTFGSAQPELWDAFTERDHLTWQDTDPPSSPFAVPESQAGGCVVPLKHREEVVGCLAVQRKDESKGWRTTDLRPLSSLAEILSIALTFSINDREQEEKRRMRHELSIATQLQRELLGQSDHVPELPGYALFGRCAPAQEVAGDFCEFKQHPDGSVAFAIIDVMGKGISAAMLGGIFRSHFLDFATEQQSPGAFLERLNRSLDAQLSDRVMFITATVGRLHPQAGEITLSNAGHTPTILLPANDKQPGEHKAVGPPLGLFPNLSYATQTIPLHPGDRLVLVTDGLYEWTSSSGDQFGWPALVDWLQRHRTEEAEVLWQKIDALIRSDHSLTDESMSDDQTLLIITRHPSP